MLDKRFIAFVLDFFISIFAIFPVAFVLFAVDINYDSIILSLMWCGLFCKDCLFGRSIGKYVMKLYIVDDNTGNTPSPFKCIIRNLTYIIGIFDFIPMVLDKGIVRLGEYMTKTHVVTTVLKRKEKEIMKRLVTILLFYLIVILINIMLAKLSSQLGLFGLLYQ